MTNEEMKSLSHGDIVSPCGSSQAYIVVANYGNHVAVVRPAEISNPAEWSLAEKPKPETKVYEIWLSARKPHPAVQLGEISALSFQKACKAWFCGDRDFDALRITYCGVKLFSVVKE
jgi:hypothetical protein